ncbi:MAG: 3-phosphoshikimate 1-carboxyvinyltransferase [Oscillospiraceae bacterium]|nr:3-phosphoshikimate 1-carboxyvinyltransferase [Oscillospiraceae bacterium]
MTVTIRPGQPHGTVCAPPSKSMAHRLLICAGLSDGESVVQGVAPSEDVLATLDCLTALGAEVRREGERVLIRGTDVRARRTAAVLHCRESGSTLRFFLPLCLLSGQEARLCGSERLLSRPLDVYETICCAQGIAFEHEAGALRVCGTLSPGGFSLPGNVSSQFISGLLFALPLLHGACSIRLRPPVESEPYIRMTLQALDAFGITAEWRDDMTLAVPGGQCYQPGSADVEGDWSNAAFFLALDTLCGGVSVTGLRTDSLQGDKVCGGYLRALAAGDTTLDIADCPDLGPVLFAAAAALHGGTFTGTARLKLKECDRGAAMQEELRKFGVEMELAENRIRVPAGLRTPTEPLDGHNDHRIVMALSVLCAKTGGVIHGAEAVRKSFPDFFAQLKALHMEVESNGMDQ